MLKKMKEFAQKMLEEAGRDKPDLPDPPIFKFPGT